MESGRTGLVVERMSGYFDSTSQRAFATRPSSFMPSVVAASYPVATTLPYLEVHSSERGLALPV
jgi:hypothetical protein